MEFSNFEDVNFVIFEACDKFVPQRVAVFLTTFGYDKNKYGNLIFS